jgi:hypothetical protein
MAHVYYNRKAFKQWLIWSIFLYACLVLNVLEPFEISISGFVPAYHLVLCGHGVVSAFFVWFLEIKIEPRLSETVKPWKGTHSLTWILFTVISVSIINWVYVIAVHYTLSGWHNMYVPIRGFTDVVPKFFAVYSVWGVICGLSALFLFDKAEIEPDDKLIALHSDNKADKFRIKESSIICFKTCDNYLELYYLSEEQKLKSRLIRSSMKRMIEQLGTQKFFRCHQSYLINKDHIQGLIRRKNQTFVEIAFLGFNVNVSRGNLKQIKVLLAS